MGFWTGLRDTVESVVQVVGTAYATAAGGALGGAAAAGVLGNMGSKGSIMSPGTPPAKAMPATSVNSNTQGFSGAGGMVMDAAQQQQSNQGAVNPQILVVPSAASPSATGNLFLAGVVLVGVFFLLKGKR